MISALILAAGTSSRLGMPKQLIRINGRPLVRVVAEEVLTSGVEEVVVVTGCCGEEVDLALAGLPVKTVFNPDYEKGQGTSLAAGVRALSGKSGAVLVLMADQPLISAGLINDLLDNFQKKGCLALRPTYLGQPGHPVIIKSDLFPALLACQEDKGGLQVLRNLGGELCCLPVDDEAVVFDVDTPEDLARLKVRLERPGNIPGCGI